MQLLNYDYDTDPDPSFDFDLDPASQNGGDLDPQHSFIHISCSPFFDNQTT
jgi:hypothetical protein